MFQHKTFFKATSNTLANCQNKALLDTGTSGYCLPRVDENI